MHTLNKNVYALAMLLSALAGFVDAVGFLTLGGHFISFMSGNTTQLAVGMASGNMAAISLISTIIMLFVLGVMLGTLTRHFAAAPSPASTVLLLVSALLAGAALSYQFGFVMLAIALMTLAMGAENAVFQRNGDIVVGLTYMTGTLVKAGQRMANALLGGEKFAWCPYILLWLGLILGGTLGTLFYHYSGMHSLWIAGLWAACLAFITRRYQSRLGI